MLEDKIKELTDALEALEVIFRARRQESGAFTSEWNKNEINRQRTYKAFKAMQMVNNSVNKKEKK